MHTEKMPWPILIGISLASFLGCIDLTIVNTALPTIQEDLQASFTQLQWVMNACLLALTASMVLSGKLGDHYGRRLYLYVGMFLFALSSLGAGLSPTVEWLIFFRFIQGISIALLYTIPVAIIPNIFPPHLHGRATGLLIAANGVGLAIGPIIGGFILSILDWQWIFWINLPLILLSFLFCRNKLPESKNDHVNKKIDWPGAALLAITFPALILATVEGASWGWSSASIIRLYLIAAIGLILFHFIEKNQPDPIIQFNLFSNRVFIVGLVANFSLALFYAVDFFLMPLYLFYMHGQTELQIGLTMLSATAMVALLSPMTGRLVDQYGPRGVLIAGYIFLSISAVLQVYMTQQTDIFYIVFAYILFGIGFACILGPSIVAAMSSVPHHVSGVAIGTVGTLHNLGGAIGLAIGTVVYRMQAESSLLSQASQQNFNPGSWIPQAVADTENALTIIQNATQLNFLEAQMLFQTSFLSGYSSAIMILVASSLLTLLGVIFGLKNSVVDVLSTTEIDEKNSMHRKKN